MTEKQKAEVKREIALYVNDSFGYICEELAKLSSFGVLSYEESINFISQFNTFHYDWMKREGFTDQEMKEILFEKR